MQTFQFGTCHFSCYYTSISMGIREADVATSATTSVASSPNGNGIGPATLSPLSHAGIGVGGSFSVDCSLASVGTKPSVWRVGFAPPTAPLLSRWGDARVPVTPGSGVTVVLGPHGQSPSVTFSAGAAPKDLSLACVPFSLQALCGDEPLGPLSNALGGSLQVLPLK